MGVFLYSVLQDARWIQLDERVCHTHFGQVKCVNFYVAKHLPICLGSFECCCKAGHRSLVDMKLWGAAHGTYLQSVKLGLVPRALLAVWWQLAWPCSPGSKRCQPGYAMPGLGRAGTLGCCRWWRWGGYSYRWKLLVSSSVSIHTEALLTQRWGQRFGRCPEPQLCPAGTSTAKVFSAQNPLADLRASSELPVGRKLMK